MSEAALAPDLQTRILPETASGTAVGSQTRPENQ
jgi:hypothetical protein